MEIGLQFHLPSYRSTSLRHLLDLARMATDGGVQQLWVTDNLQSRNVFVVLTTLASTLPVRLGAAVLVQYFRNPVDVADSAAALSELMDGRELDLGISRGNPRTPNLLRSPKPVTMLRETAQSLRRLLDGDTVQFGHYPVLASYFNLDPEHAYRLNFRPSSPVRLYGGGNAPLSLEVAGKWMDGVVFGWTFLGAARASRLAPLAEIADSTAREAGRPAPMPRVAEIKLYVDEDDAAARAACRRAVASRLPGLFVRGYAADDFVSHGVDRESVERLCRAPGNHELITDAMIDTFFVAGDPARCRQQLQEVRAIAEGHGFHQLVFSELGEDVDTSLELLCQKVLPL